MTENKTENLYTLEWKSETAGKNGKVGNYNSKELDQIVFTLKEKYSDLICQVESVK